MIFIFTFLSPLKMHSCASGKKHLVKEQMNSLYFNRTSKIQNYKQL